MLQPITTETPAKKMKLQIYFGSLLDALKKGLENKVCVQKFVFEKLIHVT